MFLGRENFFFNFILPVQFLPYSLLRLLSKRAAAKFSIILVLLVPLVMSQKDDFPATSSYNFPFESSTSTSTPSFQEDQFIINLINRERFSECSLFLLQDRFDNGESVDRILRSASSSLSASMKSTYSIKYNFPATTELEKIGSWLTNLHFQLKYGNGPDSNNNLTAALMSPDNLPVRFKVSVSNYRRKGNICLIIILMINDIRPAFIKQIYNMITPVYIPITRKDEDFYIFKTKAKLHQRLLHMNELPNRIKFKIAVGSSSTHDNESGESTGVKLNVRTVCFFCNPGGNPRMIDLPITEENLPRGDIDYFPDFVWDLNGKILKVSLPYIRAKIEADAPYEGTFNARRGNWKMLFEKFLTVKKIHSSSLIQFLLEASATFFIQSTIKDIPIPVLFIKVKFNCTYNMFVSTGLDGNKGGGGTGLQLANGSWIGVTGDLISGLADLGIVIANTPKRSCLTFVTAQPTRIYSPAALLWPFDIGMWAGIISCTLLSIIFFFTAFKIMDVLYYGKGEKWSLSVQIQFLISTFLEQDSPVLPESQALRCFVVLWIFFTMVLTNVYRSKMVTLLAFPVLGELPKTFEELAFSDYQVGFMKHGDSAYNTLAASTDPVYVKLVAEMEIFSGVGLKCLEKVVEEKYGCIAYDFAMVHLRERNLSEADTRKLVFAPARTYNIWLGLGTEGKSIYRMNFGKLLSYTRPFHLADIWDKMDMYVNVRKLKLDWWAKTNQTDKARYTPQESDDLTLRHIAGAFYVLIVCLVICSAVFLEEILTFYKKDIMKFLLCGGRCKVENAILRVGSLDEY